jgi:hypothetical protein
MHVTLAYLGTTDDVTPEQLNAAREAIASVANTQTPFSAQVQGVGSFHAPESDDPHWYSVDAPGLAALRTQVVQALESVGVQPRTEHDFTPHMTVRYGGEQPELPEGGGEPWGRARPGAGRRAAPRGLLPRPRPPARRRGRRQLPDLRRHRGRGVPLRHPAPGVDGRDGQPGPGGPGGRAGHRRRPGGRVRQGSRPVLAGPLAQAQLGGEGRRAAQLHLPGCPRRRSRRALAGVGDPDRHRHDQEVGGRGQQRQRQDGVGRRAGPCRCRAGGVGGEEGQGARLRAR